MSSSEVTFSSLTTDTLLYILLFLDCTSAVHFSMTSKEYMNFIINDDDGSSDACSYVWCGIYKNTFNTTLSSFEVGVPWLKKMKEAFLLVKSKVPFETHYCDAYVQREIPCRSGHTINDIGHNLFIQFGGATTNYEFTNSVDILTITPDREIVPWCVDIPLQCQEMNRPSRHLPLRWLHTASTIASCDGSGYSKIVIYGGQGPQGCIRQDLYCVEMGIFNEVRRYLETEEALEIFHEKLMKCTAPFQEGESPARGRAGHSAKLMPTENAILIFGGLSRTTFLESDLRRYWRFHCCNDIYKLDCSLLESEEKVVWSALHPSGSPPTRRWCHSCEMKDNNMFVFGGWRHSINSNPMENEENKFLSDFFIFDVVMNTWSEVIASGIPPSPRCQAPSCIVESIYPLRRDGAHKRLSCGYLVVFGGAYHNDCDSDQAYGSRVVDACDFHVLDLLTMTWLPINFSIPQLRGGVNGSVLTEHFWLLSGGMHSNTNEDMPTFKNDIVFI